MHGFLGMRTESILPMHFNLFIGSQEDECYLAAH